jgi:hypothetical protein
MWSFHKPGPDGWRRSLGYRTRRTQYGNYELQRWTGAPDWEHIGFARTYGQVRAMASGDAARREAGRR